MLLIPVLASAFASAQLGSFVGPTDADAGSFVLRLDTRSALSTGPAGGAAFCRIDFGDSSLVSDDGFYLHLIPAGASGNLTVDARVRPGDVRLVSMVGQPAGSYVRDADTTELAGGATCRPVDLRWADADTNGRFNAGDLVYVGWDATTTGGSAIAASNTREQWVRLTPYSTRPAGTVVLAGDTDLVSFGPSTADFVAAPVSGTGAFVDSDASGRYTAGEALYLAPGGVASGRLPIGSVRLTAAMVNAPDLVLSMARPEVRADRHEVVFPITVRNAGTVPSSPTTAQITADRESWTASASIATIAAGASAESRIAVQIPASTAAGNRTFVVVIDPKHLLGEGAAESNNVARVVVALEPHLNITSVRGEGRWGFLRPGVFVIHATVVNDGIARAPPARVIVDRPPSLLLQSLAQLHRSRELGELPSGDTVTADVLVDVPPDLKETSVTFAVSVEGDNRSFKVQVETPLSVSGEIVVTIGATIAGVAFTVKWAVDEDFRERVRKWLFAGRKKRKKHGPSK